MQSLLDQVNILIKMNVGDPYRLEHIKLMLKQKRSIYGSDRAYLDKLIHDYIEEVKTQKKLSKIRGEDPFEELPETTTEENVEDEYEEEELVELEHIYCWKCGKSIPVNSKFCLDCGSDLKKPEVKEDSVKIIFNKVPGNTIENKSSNINKKNIFIVIGVLVILAVIGGAVVLGGGFEKTMQSIDDKEQLTKENTTSNSKCGAGTVFDDTTNSCILENTTSNSKCGAGTVFDDTTNSCILE